MNRRPKFSIVIPTRNRARELYDTLRTCLAQDYDPARYEIIVSDNDSTEDVRAIVDSFPTGRIRYEHTGRYLSMSESWEFALTQARGEYVGVVCTDDAYLPNALSRVDEALTETRAEAVSFQGVTYHWPSSPVVQDRGLLTIFRYSFREGVYPAEQLIEDALRSLNYGLLPCCLNSFAKNELLGKIRARHGKLFNSFAPDIYSGMICARNLERICVLNRLLFVGGFSAGSNGASFTANPECATFTEHMRMHRRRHFFAGLIDDTALLMSLVADSLLAALHDSGDPAPLRRLNLLAYIQACRLEAADRGDVRLQEVIRQYAANLPRSQRAVLRLFNTLLRLKTAGLGHVSAAASALHNRLTGLRGLRAISSIQRIPESEHGCQNVYDAALFAHRLLHAPHRLDRAA